MAGLYRRSAVKRRSRHDEQPQKMAVTVSPMSWLALIGITLIMILAFSWLFFGKVPVYVSCEGIIAAPESSGAVFANSTGILEELFVKPGSRISKGDKIAVIASLSGGRSEVAAECEGIVSVLLAETGDGVSNGSEIIRITPLINSGKAAVFFVPLLQSQDLRPGMRAVISPISENYPGSIESELVYAGKYASSVNNLYFILGKDNNMSRLFIDNAPICTVVCAVDDPAFPPNAIVTGRIIVDETTPFLRMIHTSKKL